MSELKFSLETLRTLMADSPAYQGLSVAEKAAIENSIKTNNKPVLLYIFQQLREEADSLAISREKLAKKVLEIKPSDQRDLTDNLRTAFSPDNK